MHRQWRPLVVVLASALAVASMASAAFSAPVPVVPDSASAAQFPPPATCVCHSERVDEWSGSMHSKALVDPVFLAKMRQGDKETGGKVGAFCLKCHGPSATMLGEARSPKPSRAAAQAVGCMFCHQAVGLGGRPANVAHLLELDGTRRAQLEVPTAPHAVAYSAFHESAEICGGCHNVDHPVNGTRLETTYQEWSESPYAKEGVVCQDCHMSGTPGQIGPMTGKAATGGPDRERIYRMSFVGANVGQGDAEAARALLRTAAAVEVAAPDVVAAGEEGTVTVKVSNVGAGHYLPTGLTEVRQMWLTVSMRTSDAREVKIGERRFGTVFKDAKGNKPVEMWDATGVHSDDRIPPRGFVTAAYPFEMPAGVDQADIVATLNYRSMPDVLAKQAGVKNPITKLAAGSGSVFSSPEARAAAEAKSSQPAKSQRRDPGRSALLCAGLLAALLGLVGTLGYLARRAKRRAGSSSP